MSAFISGLRNQTANGRLSTLMDNHMVYFQLSQIYSLAVKRLGVLGRNPRSDRHRSDGDL